MSSNSATPPRVTLLVPCYNAQQFLPCFAAKVRAQTIPFDQIILYDDKSADDTVAVAQELGLTTIRGSKNSGAAFARNQLLEAAGTPWVHFHDVDDDISSGYLEELVPHVGRNDTAVFCGIRKTLIDGSEEIIRYPEVNSSSDWVRLFITTIFHLNSFIFPTEFVRSIGGFKTELRIGEDREILIRAAVNGLKASYVDQVLVGWKIHAASTMAVTSQDYIWDQEYRFLQSCYDMLPPHYRLVLADYTIHRGWYAYWRGNHDLSRRHIGVANRLGFYHENNASQISRAVSRTLGTFNYFRLKKAWASLRAALSGTS
jgi:glycosyltransferase involved in cell wall biosynthesis